MDGCSPIGKWLYASHIIIIVKQFARRKGKFLEAFIARLSEAKNFG